MTTPWAIVGYYLLAGSILVGIFWLIGAMPKNIELKMLGIKPTLGYKIIEISLPVILSWPVYLFLGLRDFASYLSFFFGKARHP